jgi:hypothetical protein
MATAGHRVGIFFSVKQQEAFLLGYHHLLSILQVGVEIGSTPFRLLNLAKTRPGKARSVYFEQPVGNPIWYPDASENQTRLVQYSTLQSYQISKHCAHVVRRPPPANEVVDERLHDVAAQHLLFAKTAIFDRLVVSDSNPRCFGLTYPKETPHVTILATQLLTNVTTRHQFGD